MMAIYQDPIDPCYLLVHSIPLQLPRFGCWLAQFELSSPCVVFSNTALCTLPEYPLLVSFSLDFFFICVVAWGCQGAEKLRGSAPFD
jgi:hypothetical protein